MRMKTYGRGPASERGFALIAMLSLAALISAYLIATALYPTGVSVANERERSGMEALRKAKAALIAYAASTDGWQAYMGQSVQPGGLPCPDTNDDGASEGAVPCASVTNRLGRLPWTTIGAEDFRDASGERLWYAVSSNFYKLAGNVINSDTPGLLTVTGAVPAGNVVAVIVAPGDPISGQNRTGVGHNTAGAYLEGVTQAGSDYTFNTVSMPTAVNNDRLISITQAELMAVVEPVVAARIEQNVKPLLQAYYNKWGAYPFAMPFASPPAAQSAYLGTAGQTKGLLPVTNTPPSFNWLSAPITVTQIPGEGTGSSTVTGTSCALNASPLRVVCQVDYSGDPVVSGDRPAIRLEIPISNVHLAFADTPSVPNPGDLIITDKFGNLLSPNWSPSLPPFPPTLGFQAQATRGAVIYSGRLRSSSATQNRVFITVLLPAPPPVLPQLSAPSIAWFLSNQWYRQTYYAVSDGYVPGGGASCVTSGTPLCLTVNNLPSPTNNKQAVLVLAGRALNGSTHPTALIADYLEGANLAAAQDITPFVYEHRAGMPTAINDRIVVIAP